MPGPGQQSLPEIRQRGMAQRVLIDQSAVNKALGLRLAHGMDDEAQSDPPEAILKRRYAHGEIDREEEEYERRLDDLRK